MSLTRRELLYGGLGLAATPALAKQPDALQSGDAFVRYEAQTSVWRCGTDVIEQQMRFSEGKFYLESLSNRSTGTNWIAKGESDEFRFSFAGEEYDGNLGGYQLDAFRLALLERPVTSPDTDAGVSLEVDLRHSDLLITLHYDIFASTPRTPLGMIRKWYRVTNRMSGAQPLTAIGMNHLRLRRSLAPKLELHYWQGGGAGPGTNELRNEPLEHEFQRTFSSRAGAPGYRVDDVYDGTSSFHPYFVLEDKAGAEGLFVGFNYLGPWSARVWSPGTPYPGESGFLVSSTIDLHIESLAPGQSFESPNSFTGVFRGDLDSAGEQLQDWQATYKWDFTRERYLWLGSVVNGHWNDPAYKQRTDLHRQEMWRIANLCRRTGARIAHEDDFWFDSRGRGVWEGIEWRDLVSYLRQSGITFKLWMPPQHFAPGTPPDVQHPEWALVPKTPDGVVGWYGLGFCVAAPGVVEYMRDFVLARERRYGTFFYRLDGWIEAPCQAKHHDHPAGNPFVQQYRRYLGLLKQLKQAAPDLGLEGCNSGGEWANWDKFEFVEDNQGSDGGGPDDLYYLSYFWPAAKLLQGPSADSRKLDEAEQERFRRAILVHRYLREQEVIGRFMRVYHPQVEGTGTPYSYLQVSNHNRTRVAFLPRAAPENEIVLFPKRLDPQLSYSVAFVHGKQSWTAKGADLMRHGIRFTPADRREIVLLNLDHAPGRGADREPPSAPAGGYKRLETYWGKTGVALRWTPARDKVILAGYRVIRDGNEVDFVGTGTFYFDESGADLHSRYELSAVDGDGNVSPRHLVATTAATPAAPL